MCRVLFLCIYTYACVAQASVWGDSKVTRPDGPRREASFLTRVRNDSSFKVGLNFAYFVSIRTQASYDFVMHWDSELHLYRSSPKGESPLSINNTLNYEEGVPFVGQCAYKVSSSGSVGLLGGVDLMGLSLDTRMQMEEALTIRQNSAFFNIEAKDSVASLQQRCRENFEKRVKDSVKEDLKNLIKSKLQLSRPQGVVRGLAQVVDVALVGPYRGDVHWGGRSWAIRPADISFDGDNLVIKGSLWFEESMRIDHEIRYHMIYRGGELVSQKVKVYKGFGNSLPSDLRLVGKKITDEIGAEAMLRFRAGTLMYKQVQPES